MFILKSKTDILYEREIEVSAASRFQAGSYYNGDIIIVSDGATDINMNLDEFKMFLETVNTLAAELAEDGVNLD